MDSRVVGSHVSVFPAVSASSVESVEQVYSLWHGEKPRVLSGMLTVPCAPTLSILEFLALRMVSEDHGCAGWLEVFYNGTWGSVCHSLMDATTVSIVCRQLGCGDKGMLSSSEVDRAGSRPRWVDQIQCRKSDFSLWQCPSDPWKHTSCSAKEEAYITCEGDFLSVSVCPSPRCRML